MRINLIILVLFSLSFFSCSPGEIIVPDPNENIAVPSSCTANNTIKATYLEDAERLALRQILANPANSWNDSIQIDPDLVDEILGSLLAVHNGFSMIYRDSVLAIYGIHTHTDPILNRILIKVDESFSWVEQWKLGNQFTGNYDIDELMNKHELNFVQYYQWANGNYALLRSDQNLNIKALNRKFEAVPGIINAQIDADTGDGNDISYSKLANGDRELIYSVGYSNCNSTCAKRRYWKFNIKEEDCNLQFLGSWGDKAP